MQETSGRRRGSLLFVLAAAATVSLGAGSGMLGACGPFTDVAADGFCPFVLEIFTLGITTGTSPTTYDPASSVSRLQMAAFLSRSVDGVLKRNSRRSALRQFWTSQNETVLSLTSIGDSPAFLKSDGVDVWAPIYSVVGGVARVRVTDGKLLEKWVGAQNSLGVVVAMGRVFVTGEMGPGRLYRIDPTQPAGVVTTVSSNLGGGSRGITYDGTHIWTGNAISISIVTPGASIPWTVTTVATGFTAPISPMFDGTNVWVADSFAGKLFRLDSAGAILQTVDVGANPLLPVFDGTNIWVPNSGSNSVSVVRASTGAVLRTLTGNNLSGPAAAAFDGQRVLVTNADALDGVSLWKAADLTPLGSFSTGQFSSPYGACSDGVNFWLALGGTNKIARF
jgi:DNA-binding beta-propeller fold protein YncE